MIRVGLVGLIAGGPDGVPRYAAALSRGLDRVAGEFPDLSLRLITTRRGAREARVGEMPVDLVEGHLGEASEGPRRILAEQLAARSAEADILHFFDLAGPVLAPRRRFTTTIHDAKPNYGFERVKMAHKRFLVPFALRRAATAIAVSGFARDEAVRLLGADPARIEVVHSGPGFVPSPGSANGAGAEPGPYLLYVGNLAPNKNLPFLIGAFSAADAEGRLLLVGRPGAGFEEIRRAATESPKRDRIEIRTGASDVEVDALYRGASMLLLPSTYEGFGFTALEAMQRGCPVLASDIPALREVSGGGAMLLPVGDRGAWAKAIGRVAGDEALRGGMRNRGYENAARYSWEATARGVCQAFIRAGADPCG